MHRFVLTGAPGSGKTTILRNLSRHGYAVVNEAATDVIATKQAGRCLRASGGDGTDRNLPQREAPAL
jgi:predicted ATPase